MVMFPFIRHIKLIFLFGFMLILSSSCEKEKEAEIIYPNPYYPVYPGSYWVYEVLDRVTIGTDEYTYDTTIVEITTSDSYQTHSYITGRDSDKDVYSDEALVPFVYNSSEHEIFYSGPIYGYDRIDIRTTPPFGHTAHKKYRFLHFNEGQEYRASWSDPRYEFSGPNYTVVDHSTNNVGESILTLKAHYLSIVWWKLEWFYFKKDVGLIEKYELVDGVGPGIDGDTVKIYKLIDYSIKK